jgi:hypothetical protein
MLCGPIKMSSTLNKSAKSIHWRKGSLLTKWYWKNWICTCGTLKQHPHLSHCTKINSKWIKDLNARPETLKLLEKNIQKMLQGLSIGNDFLNRTTIAQEIRVRIDK